MIEKKKCKCSVKDLAKALDPSKLSKLDRSTKICLIESGEIPVDLIRALAKDKDVEVRLHITDVGTSLPEDVIRFLAKDENATVRKAVSKREDLPEDVLTWLGRYP